MLSRPSCPVLQVAGSDWKLSLEGQPADAPREEPRFSTWEEVLNKQRQRQRGQGQQAEGSGASSTAGSAGSPGSAGGVADRSYYDLLGVPPSADLPAIKAAYRQLALRLHPDVNAAPDAAQRFGAMAAAYDVLSDAAARALYDQFGPDGMKGRPGERNKWGAGFSGCGQQRRALHRAARALWQARQAGTEVVCGLRCPGAPSACSSLPPRTAALACASSPPMQALGPGMATRAVRGTSSSHSSGRTSTRRRATPPLPHMVAARTTLQQGRMPSAAAAAVAGAQRPAQSSRRVVPAGMKAQAETSQGMAGRSGGRTCLLRAPSSSTPFPRSVAVACMRRPRVLPNAWGGSKCASWWDSIAATEMLFCRQTQACRACL